MPPDSPNPSVSRGSALVERGIAHFLVDADCVGDACLGAGQRMGEAGVTNAICVNQEVDNAALDERCRGFTDGLGESGGTAEVVQVDLNNPTEVAVTRRSGVER